jgi:hypothetical protein
MLTLNGSAQWGVFKHTNAFRYIGFRTASLSANLGHLQPIVANQPYEGVGFLSVSQELPLCVLNELKQQFVAPRLSNQCVDFRPPEHARRLHATLPGNQAVPLACAGDLHRLENSDGAKGVRKILDGTEVATDPQARHIDLIECEAK